MSRILVYVLYMQNYVFYNIFYSFTTWVLQDLNVKDIDALYKGHVRYISSLLTVLLEE